MHFCFSDCNTRPLGRGDACDFTTAIKFCQPTTEVLTNTAQTAKRTLVDNPKLDRLGMLLLETTCEILGLVQNYNCS